MTTRARKERTKHRVFKKKVKSEEMSVRARAPTVRIFYRVVVVILVVVGIIKSKNESGVWIN
jgi:hypothetical protein